MHGMLDVRRFGNYGEFYQARYEDLAGDAFTASMNPEELHRLLYDRLALNLTDEELDRACQRLARDGRVLFPEIEVREEELEGAGLKFLQVEG